MGHQQLLNRRSFKCILRTVRAHRKNQQITKSTQMCVYVQNIYFVYDNMGPVSPANRSRFFEPTNKLVTVL